MKKRNGSKKNLKSNKKKSPKKKKKTTIPNSGNIISSKKFESIQLNEQNEIADKEYKNLIGKFQNHADYVINYKESVDKPSNDLSLFSPTPNKLKLKEDETFEEEKLSILDETDSQPSTIINEKKSIEIQKMSEDILSMKDNLEDLQNYIQDVANNISNEKIELENKFKKEKEKIKKNVLHSVNEKVNEKVNEESEKIKLEVLRAQNVLKDNYENNLKLEILDKIKENEKKFQKIVNTYRDEIDLGMENKLQEIQRELSQTCADLTGLISDYNQKNELMNKSSNDNTIEIRNMEKDIEQNTKKTELVHSALAGVNEKCGLLGQKIDGINEALKKELREVNGKIGESQKEVMENITKFSVDTKKIVNLVSDNLKKEIKKNVDMLSEKEVGLEEKVKKNDEALRILQSLMDDRKEELDDNLEQFKIDEDNKNKKIINDTEMKLEDFRNKLNRVVQKNKEIIEEKCERNMKDFQKKTDLELEEFRDKLDSFEKTLKNEGKKNEEKFRSIEEEFEKNKKIRDNMEEKFNERLEKETEKIRKEIKGIGNFDDIKNEMEINLIEKITEIQKDFKKKLETSQETPFSPDFETEIMDLVDIKMKQMNLEIKRDVSKKMNNVKNEIEDNYQNQIQDINNVINEESRLVKRIRDDTKREISKISKNVMKIIDGKKILIKSIEKAQKDIIELKKINDDEEIKSITGKTSLENKILHMEKNIENLKILFEKRRRKKPKLRDFFALVAFTYLIIMVTIIIIDTFFPIQIFPGKSTA